MVRETLLARKVRMPGRSIEMKAFFALVRLHPKGFESSSTIPNSFKNVVYIRQERRFQHEPASEDSARIPDVGSRQLRERKERTIDVGVCEAPQTVSSA